MPLAIPIAHGISWQSTREGAGFPALLSGLQTILEEPLCTPLHTEVVRHLSMSPQSFTTIHASSWK